MARERLGRSKMLELAVHGQGSAGRPGECKMPLPWRCSQRRALSMQVEAIGGSIIFHMQPSTSQREVNAPIWKRKGARWLGRSCWGRLVQVLQQGRYVPLSVVATP